MKKQEFFEAFENSDFDSLEEFASEKGAEFCEEHRSYDDNLPTFYVVKLRKIPAFWVEHHPDLGWSLIEYQYDNLRDLLADCDWNDSEYYQVLLSYGFCALDEVKINKGVSEDFDDEVSIMEYRHFQAGELDRADYVRDYDTRTQEPLVFASYKEAQEWIAEQESQRYTLAHGEVSSPDYVIVEAA